MWNETKKAWITAVAAYKDGNKEDAEKALMEAHNFLNSMAGDGYSNNKKIVCVCEDAVMLAKIALMLDLPQVADCIHYGTYCGKFHGPYRTVPFQDYEFVINDFDRKYYLFLKD